MEWNLLRVLTWTVQIALFTFQAKDLSKILSICVPAFGIAFPTPPSLSFPFSGKKTGKEKKKKGNII